ncbi:MAG: FHA domain-containing protein [Nitriliruptoraceae bacterium]|nr:FHA domain-containing protein [Nitriliruptoraceae bacterium]
MSGPMTFSGRARPMGVLQEFERRLEGAVEGFFARIFRSGVQPVELAKAVQRYGEDRQHVTESGVVVPNVYRVTVSGKDHERLAGYGTSLPRELAEVVVRTADERGWTLRGPARVRIETDEQLRLGRFRLAGRVEVVEGTRRAAAPARQPEPAAAARPAPAPLAADTRAPIDQTQVVGAVPTSGLSLVIRSGESSGTRVPVNGTRLTAGRSSSCDLVVDDSTVSREHAAFVRRGEAWWVVDLGSTNGTKVNGARAAEHPIGPGDRIQLGDAVVELVRS